MKPHSVAIVAVAACAISTVPMIDARILEGTSGDRLPQTFLSKAEATGPTQSKSKAEAVDGPAARNKRILENLGLVSLIARSLSCRIPIHVELEDLTHAGVMGLFDAATKYDPAKQIEFAAYAKYRIRGSMLDSLRDMDFASRDLRRHQKNIEESTRQLLSELQRNPSEEEVAARLSMPLDRLRGILVSLRATSVISSSPHERHGEDPMPAREPSCQPESYPDAICANRQLRDLLALSAESLPARYRTVLALYYQEELTMREIGVRLGINESRVSQIHKAALAKMQLILHQDGIHSSNAV